MVPGSLVAVFLGIAAVAVLDLDAHGVAIVGQIDSGLPALGPPEVAAADYLKLAAAAAGVMLVGFAEGLGAAKTYAARHHYEVDAYEVDANQELLGLGAANLGSGLSSGMVVNGSLSKTAVNGGAGARSQVSGLVVAGLTILTLLFLTGLFERLPQATLAAVVIAAVIELVDIAALTALWRIATRQLRGIYGIAARPDFIAAVAALAGVLVFDTLPGLVIGVVVCRCCCSCTAPPAPMWPCSARSRACPASTATCSATPRTSSRRGSRCCGSRAGCSSPTPTRSDNASAPTPPPRAPGSSC
jgi:SulP family sulfate permease